MKPKDKPFVEIGHKKYFDGQYRTFLRIDNQTFYLSAVESKFHARWHGMNLSIALQKLLLKANENESVIYSVVREQKRLRHWIDKNNEIILKRSEDTLTHPECIMTGKCQETEGFEGGPHEGVDMCEDGCVWYKPRKK